MHHETAVLAIVGLLAIVGMSVMYTVPHKVTGMDVAGACPGDSNSVEVQPGVFDCCIGGPGSDSCGCASALLSNVYCNNAAPVSPSPEPDRCAVAPDGNLPPDCQSPTVPAANPPANAPPGPGDEGSSAGAAPPGSGAPPAPSLCGGVAYDPDIGQACCDGMIFFEKNVAGETVRQCCGEGLVCGSEQVCVGSGESISGQAFCGECKKEGHPSKECAKKYTGNADDASGFACINHICGPTSASVCPTGSPCGKKGTCKGIIFPTFVMCYCDEGQTADSHVSSC